MSASHSPTITKPNETRHKESPNACAKRLRENHVHRYRTSRNIRQVVTAQVELGNVAKPQTYPDPHSRDATGPLRALLRRSHSSLARRRRGAFIIFPDGVNSTVTIQRSVAEDRRVDVVPNGLSCTMTITGTANLGNLAED